MEINVIKIKFASNKRSELIEPGFNRILSRMENFYDPANLTENMLLNFL